MCDSNLLCFNIDKTSILTFRFSFGNLILDSGFVCNGNVAKFLGVQIDDRLKFKDHIMTLNKKLASGCYAVRVVSKELGKHMGRIVYFSLVESHLRYGIAFWGYCRQELMNSILVLQKRAIRYLCGVNLREHCKPLFVREKILTVTNIFILETVCLLHKKFKGHASNGVYNTRNGNDIPLPIPRTSLTKNSLIFESIKLYNHLPPTFRQILDEKGFKRTIKEHLVARPYYSLREFYDDSW